MSLRPLQRRPGTRLAAALVLLSVSSCHKFQGVGGDEGGAGNTPGTRSVQASGTDSSTKTKHLPNFGTGRKAHTSMSDLTSPEPSESHSDASVTRHAGRNLAPVFHWDDGASTPSHHQRRSGL